MPSVTPDTFGAVLFDLDGVIARTAKVHGSVRKQAFDEFLKKRANDESFNPFGKELDYEDYVDRQSRYDGTQRFLESRHSDMPDGAPNGPLVFTPSVSARAGAG